jgi:hypothetical protein
MGDLKTTWLDFEGIFENNKSHGSWGCVNLYFLFM